LGKGAFWVHREIEDHWLWKDKPFAKGQAWIDMILMANHQTIKIPYKEGITEIKRGEFIRSVRELANRWGWSKSKVDRFLKQLKSDSMVDQKPGQAANHICIINYDSYQAIKNYGGTVAGQEWDSSGTVAGLNNNVNNDNNDKNKNIYVLPEWFPDKIWKEFLSHRIALKVPVKKESYQRCITKFEKWRSSGYEPDKVLDYMIEKGWRSFNPDWIKDNNNGKRTSDQGMDRVDDSLFVKSMEAYDKSKRP